MEYPNNLIGTWNFPLAREKFSSKFVDSLGARQQKVWPALSYSFPVKKTFVF